MGAASDYNDFVKALLLGDVDAMNEYMNQISEAVFGNFDTGRKPSKSEPERFHSVEAITERFKGQNKS